MFQGNLPTILGGALVPDAKQLQQVRTRLAMVCQHYNLRSHMTVLQNVVEAPLHVLRVPRKEAPERAQNYLQRTDRHAPCRPRH
jgi:ABC-type histidine transport system ATPase subunit